MLFRPDQNPRPVLRCEFAGDFVGSIVIGESRLKIVRVPDVKFGGGILKNVGPKHLNWLQR